VEVRTSRCSALVRQGSSTPVLQLYSADDGCIVAATDDDADRFEAQVL
jgi:hypothetical protein